MGEVVASPDTELSMIYFPETVVLCFREALREERQPVVGVVGFEGMIGWSLLMGSARSTFLAVAEIHAGTALAISSARLLEACSISATLNAVMLRYAHNFMTQMACTIASNACDVMERRVARWLLMLHDRLDGDTIDVTHDHMGSALHVRRASVTDCLHVLEGEGILRCTRGRIVIRDRVRLEQLAGCSYGAVEARYISDIGGFGKSTA